MKSRQELITRALQKLGIPGSGQTPAAEDVAVVEAEIDPVMQDLATRNIWQWGGPDEFDDDAFVHLAAILANSVAADFGKAEDEGKRLMAEGRLRLLSPPMLSGQPQKVEWY